MLFFLESMIETALLKETFMNKKMFQTKQEFDLTTKEGLTAFVSKSLVVQVSNSYKRLMKW